MARFKVWFQILKKPMFWFASRTGNNYICYCNWARKSRFLYIFLCILQKFAEIDIEQLLAREYLVNVLFSFLVIFKRFSSIQTEYYKTFMNRNLHLNLFLLFLSIWILSIKLLLGQIISLKKDCFSRLWG